MTTPKAPTPSRGCVGVRCWEGPERNTIEIPSKYQSNALATPWQPGGRSACPRDSSADQDGGWMRAWTFCGGGRKQGGFRFARRIVGHSRIRLLPLIRFAQTSSKCFMALANEAWIKKNKK